MLSTTTNELAATFTTRNLVRSWEHVSMKNGAAGIDGVTVNAFGRNPHDRLARLQDEVLSGRYVPQPYISFLKAKGNGSHRELVNATVRDKIVARTIACELTRRHDRSLAPQSYAYRRGRGAMRAVSAVQRHCADASHAVRADIKTFFDDMDHDVLRRSLRGFGEADGFADFVVHCIDVPRFDGVSKHHPRRGVPQGSPLAPVLSNLYLHPLDRDLVEGQFRFARYADDILVLAGDPDRANGALARIQEILGRLKLGLNVDKTRVYRLDRGFPFLGFIFTRQGKTPCREARERLSRRLEEPPYSEETREEHETRLEAVRRGWENYFGDAPSGDDGTAEPDETASCDPGSLIPDAATDTGPSERAGATADEPGTDRNGDELRAALALREACRYGDAVSRCRAVLNSDERELSDSQRTEWLALLADLYDQQGLTGAARRCRSTAGIGHDSGPLRTDRSVTSTAGMVDHWLRWFGYGSGPVSRQYVDTLGRNGYRPASRGLNAAYLRDHWAGRHTLAVPVYGPSDSVCLAVLDLDVTRRVVDTLTAEELRSKRAELLDDAIGLVDLAHKAGVEGVIEDSGCKGYHVWFFLEDRVSAKTAHRFLAELSRVAGSPPEGTHRECFPGSATRPPDGNGSRIKLPLGVHRLTGNRCTFLNPDGSTCTPVEEQHLVRGHVRPHQLKRAIQTWGRWRESTGSGSPSDSGKAASVSAEAGNEAVAQVMAGCAVLRALALKAEDKRDLSHHERTVLRCVLGPMGPAGREEIHRIMRFCRNYDRRVTDRMIGTPHPNSLSCRRVREIVGELADQVGCDCRFRNRKGDYAHPLRHIRAAATTPGRVTRAENAGSCESPGATPANGEPATGPDADVTPARSDVTGMLAEYHRLRVRLLELQDGLRGVADSPERARLPFGVLHCNGPDPELLGWSVRI